MPHNNDGPDCQNEEVPQKYYVPERDKTDAGEGRKEKKKREVLNGQFNIEAARQHYDTFGLNYNL